MNRWYDSCLDTEEGYHQALLKYCAFPRASEFSMFHKAYEHPLHVVIEHKTLLPL